MIGQEIQDHFWTGDDNVDSEMEKAFVGVLGADELAAFLKQANEKQFAIVNVQDTGEEGSHWYAVFKRGPSNFEVFDSLGQDKDTLRSRIGSAKCIAYNKTAVQGPNSTKCGEFSTYFSTCRMLNYDCEFEEVFEDSFTVDFNINEAIVTKYWEQGILHEDAPPTSQ